MVTVESSTNMPTASARPAQRHGVQGFAEKVQHHQRRQDRQRIEIITTSVERQEPRKIRIISAVRPAAMAPSRSTP